MDLGTFIPAQIPQDPGDEIFSSALEIISSMSREEGIDPTLVAEKCVNSCLEILETTSSQEFRVYDDCDKELEYFVELPRQKKILDFLVKLLEHPSVQRQEILFNVFSMFLAERKHSNYLIPAYLLSKLSHSALEQFHNFVGLNYSINGNSMLSSILVSGTPPKITDYDRAVSAILIYNSTYNRSGIFTSFKTILDLYISMATSRSPSKIADSLNFPPKNLLSYIITVLLVCPDLLKLSVFTMNLSQTNLSDIIELELQGLSEIRLTEGFEIKVSKVYMNLLNSFATTCLQSPSGYTSFFIVTEHICSFANISNDSYICAAARRCEKFHSEFFDTVGKKLFSGCPDLSQPKFSPIQEFDKLSSGLDDLIACLTYIPKSDTYNPKNLVSLMLLIGLYKGENIAEKILTEIVTHPIAHRSVLATSFEFLNSSFARYWPGITKSVLENLLSINYSLAPKRSLTTLKNLETLFRSSNVVFPASELEALSLLVSSKLPYIINQARNATLPRLTLGIIRLSSACISYVKQRCIGPNFTVTFELFDLVNTIVKRTTSRDLLLDIIEDNIESDAACMLVDACRSIADLSCVADGLLNILWTNTCTFVSPLEKKVIIELREQSDISKHLNYSLFKEISGIKSNTGTRTVQHDTSPVVINTPTDTRYTHISKYAQKYVIRLLSMLIQSKDDAVFSIQRLLLDRFSHLSQTLLDPKFSETPEKRYTLSRRSSEIWHIFRNRSALWGLIEMLSQNETFLLKALSIFLPLINFATCIWSGERHSGNLNSEEDLELTINIFKTLEKFAPDPLNKASLILNLISESDIAVLSRALGVVLEIMFYNPSLQRHLKASDIPSWGLISRDIRLIVTKNIHNIGDIALFFLSPQVLRCEI